jgi:hypothetical protein
MFVCDVGVRVGWCAARLWKWWLKRGGHAGDLRNLNTLDDDLDVFKTDM